MPTAKLMKTWPTTNRASSDDPVERFRDVMVNERQCFPFYGLMRTDVLRSTLLLGDYSGSDHPLLAELALRGRFVEAPEPLFEHREHAGRSVTAFRTTRPARPVPARPGRQVVVSALEHGPWVRRGRRPLTGAIPHQAADDAHAGLVDEDELAPARAGDPGRRSPRGATAACASGRGSGVVAEPTSDLTAVTDRSARLRGRRCW